MWEDTHRVQGLMEVLSSDTRLEMLVILAAGPVCVKGLAAQMQVQRTLVSQHLRVLRAHSAVEFRQIGRERLYSLGPALEVVQEDGRICWRVHDKHGDHIEI